MSIYIQKKYIEKVRFGLNKFDWEGYNRCTFRCPFCGDSKRNLSKKRGNLFVPPSSDEFLFKCYNCSYACGFVAFLEFVAPHIKQEYIFEVFANKGKRQQKQSSFDSFPSDTKLGATSLRLLPSTNPAVKYANGRCLPDSAFDILSYTDDFKSLVAKFNEEQAEPMFKEERLVIPFYDRYGSLIAFQGRALNPNAKMRYVTVKVTNDQKIFGEDRLDRSKTVFCVEGPIDSLFIPNCIAVADGDIGKADADIFIVDNQPRNAVVMATLEKIIDDGKKVVIFPNSVTAKDINDMIVKQGYSRTDVLGLIANNVYQGLQAKVKFAEKVKS